MKSKYLLNFFGLVFIIAGIVGVNYLVVNGVGPEWLTQFLTDFIFFAYTVAAILGFLIFIALIMLIRSFKTVRSYQKNNK